MINKLKQYLSILFLLCSASLLADVEYTIISLQPANYVPSASTDSYLIEFSEAFDLTESGYVVGAMKLDDTVKKGFLFHPEEGFKEILGPKQNGDLVVTTCNDKGIIAGWFNMYEWEGSFCWFEPRAFIFDLKANKFINFSEPGVIKNSDLSAYKVHKISDNGKVLLNAIAIEDHGFHVYDLATQTINFDIPSDAKAMNSKGNVIGGNWFYSLTTGLTHFNSLDPYARWNAEALLLNEKDVVAGLGRDVQGCYKGFIWDAKHGMRIIYPLGESTYDEDSVSIDIRGINNRSQVVGSSKTDDLCKHAFIFDESLGTVDLGTLGGEESCANDINDHTQVVGYAKTCVKSKKKRAFIWDKVHGMRDLNDLIPHNSGWKCLTKAKKINNKGYIIGEGIQNGEIKGFLLIPNPVNN